MQRAGGFAKAFALALWILLYVVEASPSSKVRPGPELQSNGRRLAKWENKEDWPFKENYIPLAGPVEPEFKPGNRSAKSHFLKWIKQDLEPWRESGISFELLEEASSRYSECDGEVMRFQIVDSTLYIHVISGYDTLIDGNLSAPVQWFPAEHGEGALSGKAKIPYAILAIMDTMRHHPGEIPDLDFIICTADFAWMTHSGPHKYGVPPPTFGYNSHANASDVPFPDYTYWGHEYEYLLGHDKIPVQGWDNQYKFLAEKYATVNLVDRPSQAIWRGRTHDRRSPDRDQLRRDFVQCPARLKAEGRPKDAALFNVEEEAGAYALHDSCDYRYPVYIECKAWVTNLKHKLSCGSILLALKIEYYEWFTRGLQPNVHYVEIGLNDFCEEVVHKIKLMDEALELHAAGKSAPVADKGETDALKRPWQIAQAAQQFLRDHVQMSDVRLYIRDVLTEYASLQKFKPQPTYHAFCATGQWLLNQFSYVSQWDSELVKTRYPWLDNWQVEECRGRLSVKQQQALQTAPQPPLTPDQPASQAASQSQMQTLPQSALQGTPVVQLALQQASHQQGSLAVPRGQDSVQTAAQRVQSDPDSLQEQLSRLDKPKQVLQREAGVAEPHARQAKGTRHARPQGARGQGSRRKKADQL